MDCTLPMSPAKTASTQKLEIRSLHRFVVFGQNKSKGSAFDSIVHCSGLQWEF